jgi:hypothetical protein
LCKWLGTFYGGSITGRANATNSMHHEIMGHMRSVAGIP